MEKKGDGFGLEIITNAPSNAAQQAIDDHRKAGGFVCPYAKWSTSWQQLPAAEDPQFARVIHEALRVFVRGKRKILLFTLDSEPKDHKEGFEKSHEVLEALDRAGALLDGIEEYEPGIARSTNSPAFTLGGRQFLALAHNSLYPSDHPRYAQHAMVFVTSFEDVMRIPLEDSVAIRHNALVRIASTIAQDVPIDRLASLIKIELTPDGKKPASIYVDDSIATDQLMRAIIQYGLKNDFYAPP